MGDSGPWWVAFNDNKDPVTYATNHMVAGDRGLVIRKYKVSLVVLIEKVHHFLYSVTRLKLELQKVCLV